MLIGAGDAALEDGEIVLDCVGVPEAASHIFVDRMVDRAVAGELAHTADAAIVAFEIVRRHFGQRFP